MIYSNITIYLVYLIIYRKLKKEESGKIVTKELLTSS
jgi:hypothetical protein